MLLGFEGLVVAEFSAWFSASEVYIEKLVQRAIFYEEALEVLELLMIVNFDASFAADGSAPVQNGPLVGEHDDMRLGDVLPAVVVADVDGGDFPAERSILDKPEQLDCSEQVGRIPDLAGFGRLGGYPENALVFVDGYAAGQKSAGQDQGLGVHADEDAAGAHGSDGLAELAADAERAVIVVDHACWQDPLDPDVLGEPGGGLGGQIQVAGIFGGQLRDRSADFGGRGVIHPFGLVFKDNMSDGRDLLAKCTVAEKSQTDSQAQDREAAGYEAQDQLHLFFLTGSFGRVGGLGSARCASGLWFFLFAEQLFAPRRPPRTQPGGVRSEETPGGHPNREISRLGTPETVG